MPVPPSLATVSQVLRVFEMPSDHLSSVLTIGSGLTDRFTLRSRIPYPWSEGMPRGVYKRFTTLLPTPLYLL